MTTMSPKGIIMSTPAIALAARITEENRHHLVIVNGGVVPELEEEPTYFVYPTDPFEPCDIMPADEFFDQYEFIYTEDPDGLNPVQYK